MDGQAVHANAKEATDAINEARRVAELRHAEAVRAGDQRVAVVTREAQDKIAQAEEVRSATIVDSSFSFQLHF